MKSENESQSDLIMEYFKNHPKCEIRHPEVVDWAVATYKKRTGKVFRDPDRAIRKLSQDGFLIKIRKGVYKYDPNRIRKRTLKDFTATQKALIMKRDGYKCVICGRSKKDGVELQVDHIKPKDLGGTSTIDNGETLCGQHNYQKKNYKQTESGKKFFIRLYEAAKKNNDKAMQDFCTQILKVYEKNGVNGHIEWKR
ncbi:HNH endonuclease [Candidatus Marsarchaeota archaeon]|nr:HNH endonuclease [Candidatus Marsarchaeota archaeon]